MSNITTDITTGKTSTRELTDSEKAEIQARIDKEPDELKERKRMERNQLLEETDWTQVGDVSDSVKTKWASYRQALRDVPAQSGFPNSITWPTKPT
tara:strand:- start:300 stop:587 length:288 start_codon:yes stop_codon:yes gene_type:complete